MPLVVVGDGVDGGFPVMPFMPLAMVGDAVVDGVDGVAGPHADARETLAMPMKAPTTALRAAVAIRELNMALIGLVNHRSTPLTPKTGHHHQTPRGRGIQSDRK